ncbi:hypothetical protein V8C42DRAFT_130340 [Trichoderma barbatum]
MEVLILICGGQIYLEGRNGKKKMVRSEGTGILVWALYLGSLYVLCRVNLGIANSVADISMGYFGFVLCIVGITATRLLQSRLQAATKLQVSHRAPHVQAQKSLRTRNPISLKANRQPGAF